MSELDSEVDIVLQRLSNQQISQPAFVKAEEVVRWFGAIQAQEYLHSLWAVGLRMNKAVVADVEQALVNRTILRSWPMRGTIHFVPAEDLRWMLTLLAPKVIRQNQSIWRKAGLDEQVLAQSRTILTNRLPGKQMTRDELYTTLEEGGIPARHKTAVGSLGLHIIGWLALEGFLCFGPRRGKQPTYVLLDEWVPHFRTLGREDALAELAIRYFRSHAPATDYDFAWWSGLTLAEARLAIELAQQPVQHIRINDKNYWFATWRPRTQAAIQEAYLLPSFDEYTVAYQDRRNLFDRSAGERIEGEQPESVLGPVIVIGGRVVGTWQRTFKQDKVSVETHLTRSLSATEQEFIATAQQRFANFVGLPVEP